MSDVSSMRMSFTGHQMAPAAVLVRALQALLAPDRPDPEPAGGRAAPHGVALDLALTRTQP